MTTYKVVSKNGQSYTIGTDNILGATRTITSVGRFQIEDIVKIVKVEERGGEFIEVLGQSEGARSVVGYNY